MRELHKLFVKFIITGLFFLIIIEKNIAQDFGGGLRAGLTASEVSGDNLSGPNKVGWYAAAFTSRELTPASRLLLEIMYIRKGSRSIPSERNNFYEYLFSLEYVEIPVTFELDIARIAQMQNIRRLLIYSGLSVSRLVNHLESDDGTTSFLPGEKPDFHPAELNFLLGVGFAITENLDFRWGFSNGLTPIRPHSSGATRWYNRGQYNTVWTFGISYNIW
jgi:hypothetical protein